MAVNQFELLARAKQMQANSNVGDATNMMYNAMVRDSIVGGQYSSIPGAADTARDFNQLTEANTQLSGSLGDFKKALDTLTGDARDKCEQLLSMASEVQTAYDALRNTQFNMTNDQTATQAVTDALNNIDLLQTKIREMLTAHQAVNEAVRENADEFSGVTTSMTSMATALQSVMTCSTHAAEHMSTLRENAVDLSRVFGETCMTLARQAVDVQDTAENVREVADAAQHQMDEQKAFIQLLADQSTRTEREIKHTHDQVKQHFKALASRHALELTNGLQKMLDDLEQAKQTGGELRFNDTLSSAMQSVIERFESFARDEDVSKLGTDKLRVVLDETQAFGETMVNAMATNARLMAEYGQRVKDDSLVGFADIINERVDKLKAVVDQTVANIGGTYSKQISEETTRLLDALDRLDDNRSPESMAANMQLGFGHAQSAVKGITASQSGLDAAATALMLPEKPQGWMYRHFDGAFTTTGRDSFQSSLAHAQRVGVTSGNAAQLALEHLGTLQAGGLKTDTDKQAAKNALSDLVKAVVGNAEANLGAGRQLDLGRGQYGSLSTDDKKVVDEYLKSANSTRDSLRTVLRMLNEIDPTNDTARRKVEALNSELTKIVNTTEDLKTKTSLFDESKSIVVGGIKRVQGLLGAGLGMMGLGALTPTLGNMARTFGAGGFQSYTDDGRRHYKMALAEAYLGNDVNVGRSNYMVNNLADYYHKLTYGQVGFDELPNRYDMLVRSVGGHRDGSSGEQTAADMAKLTEMTFGMTKAYGIGDQTLASAGKALYHDMGMSAEETAGAIARMAQAAQTANVPVNKYMSTVVGMVDRLRGEGVDGRQVMGLMEAAMAQNMRVEDASELVSNMVTGAKNMAGNWNQSAFWGMMAGQGGDMFGNVVSGMLSHDENGNPNDEWFGMMAHRMIARNQFMSSLGGGPGSDLGAAMMMDDYRKQGFSQKWASALTAKAMSGDEEGLAKLLKQAEDEKDGGQKALAKGMTDANQKLAAAAEQLGVTTKTMAKVDEARKAIGESIREKLGGPLNTFADGVGNFMHTVGDSLKKLIEKIAELLHGDSFLGRTLRSGFSWANENPGWALAGLGAAGAGVSMAANYLPGWLGRKALSWFMESGSAGATAGASEAALGAAASRTAGMSYEALANAAASGGTTLADEATVAANASRSAGAAGASSASKGWLGKLLGGAKGNFLTAGIGSGVMELWDTNQAGQADPFSTKEHLARWGIDTLLVGGMSWAGGALGATLGGAGAIPGYMIGGAIGNAMAGGLKSMLGIGDEKLDEAKRLHAQAAHDKNAKQEETVRELTNSNSKLGETVETELRNHGTTSENLAKDQKEFMAKMFNKLMTIDSSSPAAAAQVAAQYEQKRDELLNKKADTWLETASLEDKQEAIKKLADDKTLGEDWTKKVETVNAILGTEGESLGDKAKANARQAVADAMNVYNQTLEKYGGVNARGASGAALRAALGYFNERYTTGKEGNQFTFNDMSGFQDIVNAHNADRAAGNISGGEFAASDVGSSADNFVSRLAGNAEQMTELVTHRAARNKFAKEVDAQAFGEVERAGKGNNNVLPRVHNDGKDGFTASSGIQLLRQYATPKSDEVKFDTLTANTADKLGMLAKWWHDTYHNMEGFEELYVTATTNGTHSPNSYHYHGQAADVAMDLLEQNRDIRQAFVAKARELGFGGDEINEYDNPSSLSSGGHMHLANPDDASLPIGASASGTPPLPGDTAPQGNTATTADDALRNAAAGARTMQQQIREYYGLADASRDKVASGQLVVGNVSTLGMLQGRMANYRGALEDFRRFSGITDASRLGYGLQGAFTVENGIATFKGMDPRLRRKQFDESMKNIDFRFLENGEREVRDTADALMTEQERVSDENERRYRENQANVQDARTANITIVNANGIGAHNTGQINTYEQMKENIKRMQINSAKEA